MGVFNTSTYYYQSRLALTESREVVAEVMPGGVMQNAPVTTHNRNSSSWRPTLRQPVPFEKGREDQNIVLLKTLN